MKKVEISDADILDVMRHVELHASQKQLAKASGFSVGKVNYILKALVEKSLVKMQRLADSDEKLKYRYVLIPGGINEKIRLTKAFIARKKQEYEMLQAELEKDLALKA